MTEGFLSQDEINALLNGEIGKEEVSALTDVEKDLLGEIGNISMGTASTALSQIINCKVNITTPVVTTTTFEDLKEEFDIPNLALNIKYISGIDGENLLVMKIKFAGGRWTWKTTPNVLYFREEVDGERICLVCKGPTTSTFYM